MIQENETIFGPTISLADSHYAFVRQCLKIATEESSANKRLHKLQEYLSRELLYIVSPPSTPVP